MYYIFRVFRKRYEDVKYVSSHVSVVVSENLVQIYVFNGTFAEICHNSVQLHVSLYLTEFLQNYS